MIQKQGKKFEMLKGIYIGTEERLQGKSALIQMTDTGLIAQFDDKELKEAFGWHRFLDSVFKIIDESVTEIEKA